MLKQICDCVILYENFSYFKRKINTKIIPKKQFFIPYQTLKKYPNTFYNSKKKKKLFTFNPSSYYFVLYNKFISDLWNKKS